MQIKNTRTNINFTSNPLYRVKLKNGVNAHFAEVFPMNPHDNEAIGEIFHTWVSKDKCHDYIDTFRSTWSDVNSGHRHFVVELIEKGKSLSDRIVALACTSNPKSNLNSYDYWLSKDEKEVSDFGLFYLETINATKSDKKFGGAGEALIYGLVKLAQKYNFDMFSLASTNDEFYKKIGLKNDLKRYGDPSLFFLDKEDYDSFLSRVEQKYGFDKKV